MATTKPRERAVRSDSIRNRNAILDAAARQLSADPRASLTEIAKAAGVGRVTLYSHFASRDDLLGALLHHSMARIERTLSGLDLRGDPWQALDALIAASWHLLSELSTLRGIVGHAMPAELQASHDKPRARVTGLLERGRREGAFRADQPLSWQVGCFFSVLHGAASELQAGHITQPEVEANLTESIRALLRPVAG
ncbi:MAG: helix-turn-helix domain-containing protein [Micropruina sp.]|uniref:TetR/AcrR family transcriptional regulator n=1 Tax=Micropruina sp. TaxID=2737536 RepID=UPI0039E4DA32